MKVFYEEGLATRFGLKLCVDDQRWRGPAVAGLAEGRTGAVLISEITPREVGEKGDVYKIINWQRKRDGSEP